MSDLEILTFTNDRCHPERLRRGLCAAQELARLISVAGSIPTEKHARVPDLGAGEKWRRLNTRLECERNPVVLLCSLPLVVGGGEHA